VLKAPLGPFRGVGREWGASIDATSDATLLDSFVENVGSYASVIAAAAVEILIALETGAAAGKSQPMAGISITDCQFFTGIYPVFSLGLCHFGDGDKTSIGHQFTCVRMRTSALCLMP